MRRSALLPQVAVPKMLRDFLEAEKAERARLMRPSSDGHTNNASNVAEAASN
jgi:hypothetical protein